MEEPGDKHPKDVSTDQADMREVDAKLLSLLACPVSKRPLVYNRQRRELVSKAAQLAFPVRDGVPLLTLDCARPLDDDEQA